MERGSFVFVKIPAVLVTLLLLCSCSAVSLSGTESLLVAPKLNKQQEEVAKAFESAVSLRSIVYKPPQNGDYRSPFIFYDIDGDGLDEAIVFYAFSGADEDADAARATVLKQSANGGWRLFYDVASPTQSPDVEFVKFEPLLDAQSSCVIIGWKGLTGRASALTVYSIRGNAFPLEASSEYLGYLAEDFDRDGLGELAVLLGGNEQNRFHLGLWRGRNGRFEEVDRLALSSEAGTPLSMVSGDLWDGARGIYIDERLSGNANTFATEIIRVNRAGLTLLAGGEPVLRDAPEDPVRINYETTFRDDAVLCMDIDGDGTVEIPYPVPLPEPLDADTETPGLVHFMQLSATGFVQTRAAVINAQAGYLVYFPDRWIDTVTVEAGRETGEWYFRKWNESTQSTAEELLRVRVSSKMSGPDVFEADYTELAVKGTTVYAAYIPQPANEPLRVTQEEVQELFRLLPQT